MISRIRCDAIGRASPLSEFGLDGAHLQVRDGAPGA
jgi:hypothetical protein